MKYLLVLPLLLALISCAKSNVYKECGNDDCRLDKLIDHCSTHSGVKGYHIIDADHYYATCNDSTYIVISYGKVSTFVLDIYKSGK